MDIAIKNIYKENVDLNQSWKFNIDTRQKTILNQGVFKYANKEKLLLYITSRCRRGGGGVMKCCCTSFALFCWESRPYLASRYRYVDVFVDIRIPPPLSSLLEEYHILRVISLVTSENLILRRFSDKTFERNYFLFN